MTERKRSSSSSSAGSLNTEGAVIEKELAKLHRGQDGRGDHELLTSLGGVSGVAAKLDVDLSCGISHVSTEMRQQIFGKNRIPKKPARWYLQLVLVAFRDKTIQLLCLFAIAQLVISLTVHAEELAWLQGVAILYAVAVILGIRALIMAFQEQAQYHQHVDITTSHLVVPQQTKVEVVRDGGHHKVMMQNLVVGDVVYLHAGERLEADGILIPGCADVVIDESQLIGAAFDTRKSADDAPFLFAGTDVKNGTGQYLVTAVGINTVSGKIIARARGLKIDEETETSEAEDDQLDTALRKKLENLVAILAVFAFGASGGATLVCLGHLTCGEYLLEGRDFNMETDIDRIVQAFIMGIVIVIVAMPKYLPLAASLSACVSMRRVRKHGALVKCMKAAGTIGHATAVCIDKTGILTQSRMRVAKLCMGHGTRKISIDGAVEEVAQRAADKSSNMCAQAYGSAVAQGSIHMDLQRMVRDNIIMSKDEHAKVAWVKDNWQCEGNKIDCALLKFLLGSGLPLDIAPAQELKTYPFNANRKRSGKAIVLPSGGCRLYVKGAGELILRLCENLCLPDFTQIRLDSTSREGVLSDIDKFAKMSMTPIGLAYRDFDTPPDWHEEVHDSRAAYLQTGPQDPIFRPETGLTFLGLFGIHETLRPNVKQAVLDCSLAGLDLRMVTGDHKETAVAIAKDVGILRKGVDYDEKGYMHPFTALTGAEFRQQVLRRGSINQAAFDEVWPVLRLLTRSSPEDKQTLVQGLMNSRLFKKETGKKLNVYPDAQVVAVTGHVTSDTSALKSAHVGIAFFPGSRTSQDAAGILLLEDGLSSVVNVCQWSRNVHDSIAKLIQFQLTVNIAAVIITVIGAVVAEGSMPISVLQMLWANLIMDSFGAVTFANELPHKGLIARIPHGKKSGLISYEMLCNLLCQSAYQLVVLIVLLFAGAGSWCSPQDPQECWEKGGIFDIASGLGRGPHLPPTQHFTLIFNAFIFMQLFNWFNSRRLHHEINIFEGIQCNFIAIWLVCAVIQVAMVQVPGLVGGTIGDYLTQALRTAALDWHHWVFCICCGILSLILQVVISAIGRRLKPRLVRGDCYTPGIRLGLVPVPTKALTSNGKALAVEDTPLKDEVEQLKSQLREEEQPLLQEELPPSESKGTRMPMTRSLGAHQYAPLRDDEQIPAPVLEFLPPGHKGLARSGDIVQEMTGRYFLEASNGCCSGEYTFDPDSRQLHNLHNGEVIGKFVCEPISTMPLPCLFGPGTGNRDFPCIRLEDSEIMAQIQTPANEGAYFVLPSQLNGAEYPSHDTVVDTIEKYKADNTGGPRGQLAVHPAAGQFLLDNAESDRRPQGINAMDGVLEALWLEGFDFKCKNGYLEVPHLQDPRLQERALMVIRQHLHKLRILAMQGVTACGLTSDRISLSKARHKVNLIYSSAIPVQAYLNAGVDAAQKAFQQQVADEILIAQYYGALRLAARPLGEHQREHVKVFLMPLGGGVFNNSWESIASSMSRAVEMLDWEEREKLDIHVLTWRDNPHECEVMTELLLRHGKLKVSEEEGSRQSPSQAPLQAHQAPSGAAPQEIPSALGRAPAGGPSRAGATSSSGHLVQTPPLAEKQQALSAKSAAATAGSLPQNPEAFSNYGAANMTSRRQWMPPPEERIANYRLQWNFEDTGLYVRPLGLEIKWGDGCTLPTVGELQPGKKAAKRGLMPGDIVVEVNSIPTFGRQKEELLPLLQTRPLLLQVERQKLETNVRWAYMELQISISQGTSGQSGIEIDESGSSCVIVWVRPGTPAYASGVMAGDALVAINGQPIRSLPTQKARALLEEAQLQLTLHRRPVSHHPVPESFRKAKPAMSGAR